MENDNNYCNDKKIYFLLNSSERICFRFFRKFKFVKKINIKYLENIIVIINVKRNRVWT